VVLEVSKDRNSFETPGLMTEQHSQEELSNHLKALEKKELGQYFDTSKKNKKTITN
jgi:hypothetical protein